MFARPTVDGFEILRFSDCVLGSLGDQVDYA